MQTNISDLRESNEFLNLLLDNINSAVLIADRDLSVSHVNDFFFSLFGAQERSLETFGQASGCSFSVRENAGCGATSNCVRCQIKNSLGDMLKRGGPADKLPVSREFLVEGRLVKKHLEFTLRPIRYQGRPMVLVLIYDVTDKENKRRELARKQKMLDRDLADAAGIQKSLLPGPDPCFEGLDLAYWFSPCQKIGGDVFNAVPAINGQTAIYMVDVCGHGVSAALVSVAVSQHFGNLLHSACGQGDPPSPQEALSDLYENFPFERFDTYFTCVYAVLDPAAKKASIGVAGHPAPVVRTVQGPVRELDVRGPAVGLGLPGANLFQPHTLQWEFNPGDALVFYTDGVTDAQNKEEKMFGKNRLLDALSQKGERSARELVDSLSEALKSFSGKIPLDDDVSILAVRMP